MSPERTHTCRFEQRRGIWRYFYHVYCIMTHFLLVLKPVCGPHRVAVLSSRHRLTAYQNMRLHCRLSGSALAPHTMLLVQDVFANQMSQAAAQPNLFADYSEASEHSEGRNAMIGRPLSFRVIFLVVYSVCLMVCVIGGHPSVCCDRQEFDPASTPFASGACGVLFIYDEKMVVDRFTAPTQLLRPR